MKTLLRLSIVSLLFTTFIVACTKSNSSNESTPPIASPDSKPTTTATPPQMETSNCRGSNCSISQPLDSFIKNPKSLPSYQKFIEPIYRQLVKVKDGSENYFLDRLFDQILEKKVWYILPSDLQKLPDNQINFAIPADQIAAQDFKQILINKNLFDQLSEEEQAKLILQEIILGIRLTTKLESHFLQCSIYFGNTEQCNGLSKDRLGTSQDLTSTDYADIRATGTEIFSKYNDLPSWSDWSDLMWRMNFSSDELTFNSNLKEGFFTSEQVAEMTRTAGHHKKSLQFGFTIDKMLINSEVEHKRHHSRNFKSTESCRINIRFENNDINKMTLDIDTPNNSLKLYNANNRDEILYYSIRNFEKVTPLVMTTRKKGIVLGDRYYSVKLYYSSSSLTSVSLTEYICTNRKCLSSFKVPSNDEGHFSQYTCSVEEQLD